MITFGALYFLTPRLWNRERLYSLQLVSWHFWLATIGIVLYASSMWVTGIMEGLMWREVDAQRLPCERLRRHGGREVPDVCGAGAGRDAVPDRRAHHVLQPVDDGACAAGQIGRARQRFVPAE